MAKKLNLTPAQKQARIKASKKAYADRNREVINARAAARRAEKGGVTISISKRAYDAKKARSKEDVMPILREMLSSAKTRAKTAGRAFEIDLDHMSFIWLKQRGICNMSGLQMTTAIGGGSDKVSLDRIDSTQGYIKGNVQFVVAPLNSLKGNLDNDEFIKLCKTVAAYNS